MNTLFLFQNVTFLKVILNHGVHKVCVSTQAQIQTSAVTKEFEWSSVKMGPLF